MIQEQNFGAIGDTSGKDIYTKVEYTYECNSTNSIKGECTKWKRDSDRTMELPEDQPVVFKDEDFSGGLGEMAKIFAAYSQLDHIWSGWKGICYDGVVEDFSGFQDPAFIAGILAQAMGADIDGLDEFNDYAGYAQCAVQMTAGVANAMQEYQDEDIPCDPVDEFCDEDDESSDENTLTITRDAYEKLLKENPEYEDYIEIVSEDSGGPDSSGDILLVKIIQPKNDTSGQGAAEAAAAMQKIKDIKLAINTAFIAYDAYTCFSSASGGQGGASNKVAGPTSGSNPVESAATGIASRLIASTGCVPCSIGFSVALELFNSFSSVDTCGDKDDAKLQGERHMATFAHKKEDMCHFIRKESDDGIFTKLDKYYYCCYDDIFSRILAEQVKAQYAKDWKSCSDITLKEVTALKMGPCPKENGIDPKTIAWDANYAKRTEAWQYQEKCVDLSELSEHLSDKFNANIDQDTLYDQLEDLQNNVEQ